MNTIDFNNKPEFRTMWKKIFNNKKTKPTFIEQNTSYGKVKFKEKGWLMPEHFILFNLFIKKPINCGFILESEGYKLALNNLKRTHMSPYAIKSLHSPYSEYISLDEFTKLLKNVSHSLPD